MYFSSNSNVLIVRSESIYLVTHWVFYTHVKNYVYMHKFTDFSETMTYNLMNFRGMIHNIMTHKCKRKN